MIEFDFLQDGDGDGDRETRIGIGDQRQKP